MSRRPHTHALGGSSVLLESLQVTKGGEVAFCRVEARGGGRESCELGLRGSGQVWGPAQPQVMVGTLVSSFVTCVPSPHPALPPVPESSEMQEQIQVLCVLQQVFVRHSLAPGRVPVDSEEESAGVALRRPAAPRVQAEQRLCTSLGSVAGCSVTFGHLPSLSEYSVLFH